MCLSADRRLKEGESDDHDDGDGDHGVMMMIKHVMIDDGDHDPMP